MYNSRELYNIITLRVSKYWVVPQEQFLYCMLSWLLFDHDDFLTHLFLIYYCNAITDYQSPLICPLTLSQLPQVSPSDSVWTTSVTLPSRWSGGRLRGLAHLNSRVMGLSTARRAVSAGANLCIFLIRKSFNSIWTFISSKHLKEKNQRTKYQNYVNHQQHKSWSLKVNNTFYNSI